MRLVFFPAPTALAITPHRLRLFLSAHGAPRALAKLEGLPLAGALFAASLDDRLADASDLLARLASKPGKRALVGGASAMSFPLEGAASLPPAEFAAHVLTARHEDPRLHGVVKRALLTLAEMGTDAAFAYEFVAPEPQRARPLGEAADNLRTLNQGASWSELWLHEDDRGVYSFAFLRPDDDVVAVEVDSKLGPRSRTSSHLRFDVVAVDVAAGRIAITTRHARDVKAIKAAVGLAVFGDPRFFGDRPAFTARPIEELGSAGLAGLRLPAPILRVRVIACTKELIGEGRQRATGSRALALIEDGPRVAGGYLSEITLRFDIAGEDSPVDVEVRLPNRFRCTSPR